MRTWRGRDLARGAALLLLGLVGCKTLEVRRLDEAERFRRTLRERTAALKIEPGKPLSMDRCVEIALANSLDQRVRQLQLSLQDEQVRLAKTGWYPKASATYVDTRRSNKALTSFGGMSVEMEDQRLQSFTVQAVVPVLDWGSTYYAYQSAKDRRIQERLTVERSKQTLARDVRVAYARLAGLERQARLAAVGLLAARELLRVSQSLEREGLGTRAETAAVEAGLAQAAFQWSLLRRAVEQARLALAQLLSLSPGATLTIDDQAPPLRPLPAPADIPKLEQSALDARPELYVQDRERRIAASAVRDQFAQFLPQVDGLLSYNWSSLSTLVNPGFFRYGYQVADSLLDQGKLWYRYQLARKGVSLEEERTHLLSLGILYEVDFRVLGLYTAYDSIVTRDAVVKSQQEALKQMVSLYLQGLETGTNTVRTLAEMYLARLLLDQVQTDYQAAWYELETAALPEAPVPLGGPQPPTPLPKLVPAPALDTLRKVLDAAPAVDLRQFPELEGLLKAAGIGEKKP